MRCEPMHADLKTAIDLQAADKEIARLSAKIYPPSTGLLT
jgi:hypothetical protein